MCLFYITSFCFCPIDSDPLSFRDVISFFQPSALSLTCHICAGSDSLMSFSQTFRSSVRVPHVVGMASGRTLQRLRALARDNGPERLKSTLLDYKRDELRALAQAAGLRVRKDGTATWLPMGELRTALLEHLAPLRAAAPEEVAAFALFSVSCFVLKFGNSMAILKWF